MREFLSRHLFSPLQGMRIGTWQALLRRHRFAIDARYWPRASFQSAISLMNSGLSRTEDAAYRARIESTSVLPPLFILGHFRHGTTHLHNLLGQDPQFTFPTLYQTLYPSTFLTTEAVIPRLGACLLLRRRPHDNMALGFGVPNEDELALCAETGLSPYLGWVFPRQADQYDRFLSFDEASEGERDRWRSALLGFLRKVTLRANRPLILKSPPHTARIRLLLEVFPEARFVHIRRHPLAVFSSSVHMYAQTMRYWQLQDAPPSETESLVLARYRAMYEAYFDQRPLIPDGRFCELAYEDLEHDPIGQVEAVYEALALPGFAAARPRMAAYLESIRGYRKNEHPTLPEPIRRRVAHDWSRCFEAWGYSSEGVGER